MKGELVRADVVGRELAAPDVKDRAWVEELLADWLGTKAPTTLKAYQRDFADFAGFVTARSGGSAPEFTGDALAALLGNGEDRGNRIVLAYKKDLMGRVDDSAC